MKRPSPDLLALATVLAGAADLAACRSDDYLGPAPRLSASHMVLGTSTVPPPVHNEVGIDPVSTGIDIPEGAEVTVTVSGLLHYSLNQNRPPCSPQPPVQPPGGLTDVGPAGFPEELYPEWLYTGHGVVAWIPERNASVDFQPRDPSAGTVSGRLTGPGTLWVKRFPGFPGSCSNPDGGFPYEPDYFVSGTQTLTVEVVDPSLGIEVVCTGSGAPRGSMLSCEARPQPAGQTLVVTAWTFTSTAGDVVSRQTNNSDVTWAGQLVVDGRIDVTGTVAGHPASGSASVTVTARDWSTKTVRTSLATPGPDGLPIRPDSFGGQLGNSSLHLELRTDVANYAVVIPDDGPNHAFTYMTDIPYETFDTARVNYPAMMQGSDWYRIQYPRDTKRGQITYCGQPRVLTLPPLVEAHEGTDPANQPNSHVGIFVNDVTRGARVKAENLAGPNPNPEPTRLEIEDAAYADSRAMDHDSRNNIKLPCVFTYDYSRLR